MIVKRKVLIRATTRARALGQTEKSSYFLSLKGGYSGGSSDAITKRGFILVYVCDNLVTAFIMLEKNAIIEINEDSSSQLIFRYIQ